MSDGEGDPDREGDQEREGTPDGEGDPDRKGTPERGPDDGAIDAPPGADLDDPAAALSAHERSLATWLDRLRERRDRLATLGGEFDDLDREDLPESVADSLSTLLSTLEADLDAQIADLEGEIERVRELRATLEGAEAETVTEELETYVATMDGLLAEKRETVEELVGTTDRLIDRFERVIAGR